MIRRMRADDGMVLPMVLLFVALFGLTVSAILGWATNSFALSRSVRDRSSLVGTANGGIDYAARRLQLDIRLGADDLSCIPLAEPSGEFSVTMNGSTADVDFAAMEGSGLCLVDNGSYNTPEHAILAFTDFDIRSTPFTIKGPIHSNTRLRSGPDLITVEAAGDAHPSSAASVTLNPAECAVLPPGDFLAIEADAEQCGAAVVEPNPMTHPVYGSSWLLDADPSTPCPTECETSDVLTARGPGAEFPCADAPGNIACFSPGSYAQPPSLADPTKLYWFKPGVYYFGWSGDWNISGYSVVAGKLASGVDGPEDVPGACATGGGGPAYTRGAQWILAGPEDPDLDGAKIVTSGATSKLEMCAMPWQNHERRQRIALYGVSFVPPVGWPRTHGTYLIQAGDDANIWIHGTVYGDGSTFSARLGGGGILQVDRGLAVASAVIDEPLPAEPGAPIVEVPEQSEAAINDRLVHVTSVADGVTAEAVVRLEALSHDPSVESWFVSGPG